MGKIQILPENLSNRIAAGEVVERPASVVKELFENAIDAGATRITVEIERAGARLIRVSDNGSGMDEADALLCFSPHATSKIHTAEDIENIVTLGFRGEALPSIAAVSRLTLRTRTADSPEGVEIRIEGGKMHSCAPAGLPVGTEITVRDLFFNVPARKKFLRSSATEEAHIQEVVTMMALGFPEVAVSLRIDGKMAMQAASAHDLLPRAAAVFGRGFAGKMLPVDYQEDGIAVYGLVAAPGWSRPSRREQRTFVNGRAVESQSLYRGIREGYGTLADFGRFSPVVLNLVLPACEYDINVHPTKREVRFRREYAVSRAVEHAVRNALKQAAAPEIVIPDAAAMPPDDREKQAGLLLDSARVTYELRPEAPEIPELSSSLSSPGRSDGGAAERLDEPDETDAADRTAGSPETDWEQQPKLTDRDHLNIQASPVVPPLAQELRAEDNLEYLGIVFGTYILTESRSGDALLLIDFHAAHERVQYETLLARAARPDAALSQALLLPGTAELGRPQAAFLARHAEMFAALGFELSLLSSNTVMISAIPAALPGGADWEQLLLDTVSALFDRDRHQQLSLEALARAACHAAVRAHDKLEPESACALLRALSRCRRPDVCPHGRPTVLKLTRTELGRRFGRL